MAKPIVQGGGPAKPPPPPPPPPSPYLGPPRAACVAPRLSGYCHRCWVNLAVLRGDGILISLLITDVNSARNPEMKVPVKFAQRVEKAIGVPGNVTSASIPSRANVPRMEKKIKYDTV